MAYYNWKLYKVLNNAIVYIDKKRKRTRIDGKRYSYFYDGLYPNHFPIPMRKIKNG